MPPRRLKRPLGRTKTPKVVSKPISLSKVIKEADTKVSLHVRQKYADKDGMVKCYTCGTFVHWKRIHCGHYISRSFKFTRWDLDNLRPQEYACNVIKKGMSHIFRENLVNEIGEQRVKDMEQRSKQLFTMPLKDKLAFIESMICTLS